MQAVVRNGWAGRTIEFAQAHNRVQFNPARQKQDVLLQVRAAGINPVDYKMPRLMLGKVVGIDVSGVVLSVGENVTTLKPGDEVFGAAHQGSLAEQCVAKADNVAHKPAQLSWTDAAALNVAYLTTLQALRDFGKVNTPGKKVLIVGASGGCGIAGLQIARALGASTIVGVCSAKNKEFVKEHFATSVIAYDDPEEFQEKLIRGGVAFDCIYDTATGSGAGENYPNILKPLLTSEGQYVHINGTVGDWTRMLTNMQAKQQHLVLAKFNSADLAEVARLLLSVEAKPIVEVKTFDPEGVTNGFDALKSRRTKGKIVFDVGTSPHPTSQMTSTKSSDSIGSPGKKDD
eukprot:Selendium_serpulae@DN3749_c0_g1_i1.p1